MKISTGITQTCRTKTSNKIGDLGCKKDISNWADHSCSQQA